MLTGPLEHLADPFLVTWNKETNSFQDLLIHSWSRRATLPNLPTELRTCAYICRVPAVSDSLVLTRSEDTVAQTQGLNYLL